MFGSKTEIRVGQGCDMHRFAEGRELFLGGVKIEHDKGLLGHSDADALLHAITDALLGAAALGDIGKLFPDTDPKYKDADSKELLARAWSVVASHGWTLVNIDCTVITEAPKLAPHIPVMRESIAAILKLYTDAVSVKATTAEQMGALGQGEGLMAQAVVLISREK